MQKSLVMSVLLSAAALMPFSSWATDSSEKFSMLLVDFENEDSARKFIPMKDNSQKVTRVTDPKLVISGKASGCWQVPKEGTGEHRWPRATMHLPEDKRIWDMFDCLELDIINPDPTESRFSFNVYDTAGEVYTPYTQAIKPGHTSYIWKFPDSIRGKTLARFMLVTGHPQRPYTLYIDNIRISTTRELFNKRIDRQLTRLQADWQESLWQKGNMQKEFDSFKKRLTAMKQSRKALKDLLLDFQKITAEYKSAKTRLIANLNDQPIREFQQKFPAGKVWGYGWVDGMQKVYRKDLPYLGKIGGTAQIALARREAEGVQIVLRSYKDLTNVRLHVSDLKNKAANAVLPASAIKVATVAHVKPLPVAYPTEPAQWRPDPLMDYMTAIPLEKDVWQAFFLDVKTLPNTRPGTYEGVVTASADNAPDLKIPLKVTVWNFTLPETLSHPSLVNYHTDSNHTVYTENPDARKEFIAFRRGQKAFSKLSNEARKLWYLELATKDLLLEHLITPTALYITKRRHDIREFTEWEKRRGSFYNITYVPPMSVAKGQGYTPWARKMVLNNLAAIVPDLRKHDLMKKSYLYTFDEINDEKFFSAVEILSEIKKLYPDIRTVTTAGDITFGKDNGLDKVIDCWCPQVERFVEHIDRVREVQKSGKKVWYYTCLWDPGMDMLTEKPLTSVRLLVGLNQIRLGSDGFLYYAVNSSQRNHKPIKAMTPLTEHNGQGCPNFTGEGLLIYATIAGPQPSIRLKAYRDGLEDIEYCYLLRKLPADKLSSADRQRRDALLKVPREVITDLEIFDQTGEKLDLWRKQAAELLERYSAAASKTQAVKTAPQAGNKAPAQAAAKAAVQASGVTASLTTSWKPLYQTSVNAPFTLKVMNGKTLLTAGKVTVRFTNSLGKTLKNETVDLTRGNPVKLYCTMSEPGIIYAYVTDVADANGNKLKLRNNARAAAGFDMDKIAPADTEPADFMEFWQKAINSARDAKVTVAPLTGRKYVDHDPFLITVNMPDGEKVYASLLRPKKREAGKSEITVSAPGAGPGHAMLFPPKNDRQIRVFLHVHKYAPSVSIPAMKAALDKYQKKIGMPYQFEGIEKPETYFYYRVIAGFSRIIDYLTTLPEWDQKNLYATGSSQGGFLTMALTALNKKITAAAVNVPAMCDHAGWKLGRQAGWPQIHKNVPAGDKTAPYYDVCNFANHITVPVYMAVGYLDSTAPAVGGYAAYNRIKSTKQMLDLFARGHEVTAAFAARSGKFLQSHKK